MVHCLCTQLFRNVGQKIRMIKLRELYDIFLVDPCISPLLLLLHTDAIHLKYAFTSRIHLIVWNSNETITMNTIQCQIILKRSCHYPSPKPTWLIFFSLLNQVEMNFLLRKCGFTANLSTSVINVKCILHNC